MKSKWLILVAILMLLILPSTTAKTTADTDKAPLLTNSDLQLSDGITARILVDESHTATNTELWTPGNASRFGSMLMQYGHNVTTNFDKALDSGILDTYDVLMLFFPQVELTASEVSTVHSFVENGGGLVLVGIDNRPDVSNYTSLHLNAVSEDYGIVFNADAVLGRATRSDGELVEHHITYDVDSILAREGNFLQSCTLEVSSPATTLATVKGNDFLAVAESGSGKVVAIGSAAPFFVDERDSWLISNDDSHQLCLNIIDWLIGEEPRKVVLPEEYVITLRNGPELTQSELQDYKMFVGLIHDHTTYSDGQDSAKDMLMAAVDAQLDFMVMTDHSWENPSQVGIYGGLECQSHATRYGLDILTVVGAELSNGPHVVGFPLTENIWSGVMTERVGGIHDQGAIAILAHPLLGQGYIEPWTNYDTYGFDAFEVINTDFFYGEGEAAFYRQFVVASDGHSKSFVGQSLNAVFVKNPSGPNGRLTQDDLVDAILNRSVVGLNNPLDVVIGDKVWVQRYLDLRDEAKDAIASAEDVINQAVDDGASVNLASAYLANAKTALEFQNPARAIALATSAASEYMLNIDLSIADAGFGLLQPYGEASLTLTLTNNRDSDTSVNITPFFESSIALNEHFLLLQADGGETATGPITGLADNAGYTDILLNIKDFNSPEYIHAIILRTGGLIANVTATQEAGTDGVSLTVILRLDRGDAAYISSAFVTYTLGQDESTADMENLGDGFGVTLGPFQAATNVTFDVTVVDVYGNTFLISDQSAIIEGASLPFETLTIIIVALAGVGVVAVFILLRMKR